MGLRKVVVITWYDRLVIAHVTTVRSLFDIPAMMNPTIACRVTPRMRAYRGPNQSLTGAPSSVPYITSSQYCSLTWQEVKLPTGK